MNLEVPTEISNHPAWIRLSDQEKWYDSKSNCCQKKYKILKITQVFVAVLIPLFAHIPNEVYMKWTVSSMGAFIAFLETIQHLNQYSRNWIDYRSTAERLKHEKFLFLSAAGPYSELDQEARLQLLATRVEDQISMEHTKWSDEIKKSTKEN